MNPVSFKLHHLFRFATYLGGLFFLVGYLILPMRSLQNALHLKTETFDKNYGFLLFACVLATLFAAMLAYYFKLPEPTRQILPDPKPKLMPWVGRFQILLSLLILARTVYEMDRPFDNDELDTAMKILEGDYSHLWLLFHNSTHPITGWLAVLSTKIGGISIWSIRLPSVLLATVFLWVLYGFCRQYLKPLSIVFIYGHLLASAIVIWYFHSIRGYVAMMVLILLVTKMVFSAAYSGVGWRILEWVGFMVAYMLLPFSHGFGTLFGIFLPFAIVAWKITNRAEINRNTWRLLNRIVLVLIPLTPLFAFCLGYSIFSTLDPKYMNKNSALGIGNGTFSNAIASLLSGSHTLQLKLFFLLVGFCLVQEIRNSRLQKYLGFWLLLFYLGFAFFQRVLMEASLNGRFFLGALPLLLFVLFQCIENSQKAIKYGQWALVIICFLVFPAIDGDPKNFQVPHDNFHAFIKMIRSQVKSVGKNCVAFSYSGATPAEQEALLAERYYALTKNKEMACPEEYLVHFGWPWQNPEYLQNPEDRKMATVADLPKGKKLEVIHTDGEGRFLTRVIP